MHIYVDSFQFIRCSPYNGLVVAKREGARGGMEREVEVSRCKRFCEKAIDKALLQSRGKAIRCLRSA